MSALAGAGTVGQSTPYPYRAAMYTSIAGVSQELQVFPFSGHAIKVAMPFPLGWVEYVPDGRALYATSLRPDASGGGLLRIDFNPVKVSPVRGSQGIGVAAFAIVAGGEKIVISVGRTGFCGLLELNIPTGELKTILQSPPCNSADATLRWSNISVSPDGTRATALWHHGLQLVDLTTGKITALRDGLVLAAWSPDGKWLAAIRGGSDRTILLDAHSLESRKTLEGQALVWSPDSRYLLATTHRPLCGAEIGTLVAVDVGTGKRTEIESSKCLVDRNTIGWVRADIAP